MSTHSPNGSTFRRSPSPVSLRSTPPRRSMSPLGRDSSCTYVSHSELKQRLKQKDETIRKLVEVTESLTSDYERMQQRLLFQTHEISEMTKRHEAEMEALRIENGDLREQIEKGERELLDLRCERAGLITRLTSAESAVVRAERALHKWQNSHDKDHLLDMSADVLLIIEERNALAAEVERLRSRLSPLRTDRVLRREQSPPSPLRNGLLTAEHPTSSPGGTSAAPLGPSPFASVGTDGSGKKTLLVDAPPQVVVEQCDTRAHPANGSLGGAANELAARAEEVEVSDSTANGLGGAGISVAEQVGGLDTNDASTKGLGGATASVIAREEEVAQKDDDTRDLGGAATSVVASAEAGETQEQPANGHCGSAHTQPELGDSKGDSPHEGECDGPTMNGVKGEMEARRAKDIACVESKVSSSSERETEKSDEWAGWSDIEMGKRGSARAFAQPAQQRPPTVSSPISSVSSEPHVREIHRNASHTPRGLSRRAVSV